MSYNQKIGKIGEDLAEKFLEDRGYKIIERNIKTSYQEIDIIAKIKDFYIFVEVKTRTNPAFGYAEEIIGHKKIQNLKKAIMKYSQKNKVNLNKVRLDLVAINIDKTKKSANIKHYKDIF